MDPAAETTAHPSAARSDMPGPAGADAAGGGGEGTPPLPRDVRVVREERRDAGGVEVWTHPAWDDDFPWLVQGTTGRGGSAEPLDMALFGRGEAGCVQERWRRLGSELGMPRLVHGRQVHGAAVRFHSEGPPGLHVAPDTDGHATRAPGVLLTIATADCIPVSVVDPVRRAVAALHAGWRGVVAGVLERGLEVLAERVVSRPADLHVHLGPAICGRCYEVGPEVHQGLGLEPPSAPAPVDLRAVVARRAVRAGVPPANVTVSAWCTRCGDPPFFSHRGGCVERQVGFLGRRLAP